MPRIEGNFAITPILKHGKWSLELHSDPEGETLFYVTDQGGRYQVCFPSSDKRYSPQVDRMLPVESQEWVKLVPLIVTEVPKEKP